MHAVTVGGRGPGSSRQRFVQSVGVAGLATLAGCALPFREPAPPRLPRIGYLGTYFRELSAPPPPGESETADAFLEGLRDLGYEEGRTHTLVWRQTDRGHERVREFAAELVRVPVDVIVVTAGSHALAAEATATIPIVAVGGRDPVATGLADSYARPGRNVTGVPYTPSGPFMGKLVQLLKEASPGLSRLAVLQDGSQPAISPDPDSPLRLAARSLGVEVQALSVLGGDELATAFDAAVRAGVDGLLFPQTGLLSGTYLAEVAALALQHRLPSIGLFRNYADAGGLMIYGTSLRGLFRRAAVYVDKILKGANPATLPIEQPREFDIVVNLKTAAALGLTLPRTIMIQATELIE